MKKLILGMLIINFIAPLNTATARTIDQIVQTPSITFSNPADAITDFALLTNKWDFESSQSQMCNSSAETDHYAESTITSTQKNTGYTITQDGITYDIYETNAEGIGWIMGFKDRNASIWSPLTSHPVRVFPFQPPYEGQAGFNPAVTLGAQIRFAYVKIPGKLIPGEYTLEAQNLALFSCRYLATGKVESAIVRSQESTITLAPLTCNVTNSRTVSVPMGEFYLNELPGMNRNFGQFDTAVELSCDKGILPAMTITDASDSGNVTDIITLSPDSTAKGVGVQVFYQNESLAKFLGPDSSNKGNTNQFFINNGQVTTTNNQAIQIPLNFKYIQTTQDVTPGSANAVATVTFSYQ